MLVGEIATPVKSNFPPVLFLYPCAGHRWKTDRQIDKHTHPPTHHAVWSYFKRVTRNLSRLLLFPSKCPVFPWSFHSPTLFMDIFISVLLFSPILTLSCWLCFFPHWQNWRIRRELPFTLTMPTYRCRGKALGPAFLPVNKEAFLVQPCKSLHLCIRSHPSRRIKNTGPANPPCLPYHQFFLYWISIQPCCCVNHFKNKNLLLTALPLLVTILFLCNPCSQLSILAVSNSSSPIILS